METSFATMPKSKKKKGPNLQPYPQSSTEIASLMSKERNLMITRAITSGRKHGINLTTGKANPGLGDCAFEALQISSPSQLTHTGKCG